MHFKVNKIYISSACVLTDMLYVAMCNPVCLYSMKEGGETIQCMELYDVFPKTISGVWQPFVTIAPLGSPLDGQVVLHEEQVCTRCLSTLPPQPKTTHTHMHIFA